MKELDIRVLWDLLIQNLRVFIVAILVVGAMSAGVTTLTQEDAYRSTCSMYVMNITTDSAGQTTGISSSGLDASQRMVNEFIEILRSESVLQNVQHELGRMNYNYSVGAINSSLSMSAVNDTALLQITCTTGDPQLSKAICDSIQRYAPEKVTDVMLGIGTITTVDTAKMGAKIPSKAMRNGIFGGIVGFIIAYGIYLVNHMLDNTIKDEKDLKTHYNVNVLGVVPNINNEPEKKKHSAKKQKGVQSNG